MTNNYLMYRLMYCVKQVIYASTLLLLLCGATFADDGFVRLAIKGTKVNLRPQPRTAGRVIAQINNREAFFAEKWPITCDEDGSQWYKIVLPVPNSGKIKQRRDWDSRFIANVAYVSANLATITPLKKGDMESILKTPFYLSDDKVDDISVEHYMLDDVEEKFDWMNFHTSCVKSVGANLPEIVHKWGEAKIERNAYEFVGEYVLYTTVEQPDFQVTFYEALPEANGTMKKALTIQYLQTFFTKRKGALIGGLHIGHDDKNSVRILLGDADTKGDDEAGEYWNWHSEFNDLYVHFDVNGLVLSMTIEARAAN
jgi:hypothetical protein